MTKTKKIKSITVMGRRWFQKTYGNTYCSAQVIVNGESVASLGPMYGYGDYYLQAAFEWLTANGFVNPKKYENGSSEGPSSYCRDRKILLVYSASDVRRERDL